MSVVDSPCKPPPNHHRLFRGKFQAVFFNILRELFLCKWTNCFLSISLWFAAVHVGFSFVAPDLVDRPYVRPTVDEVLEYTKVISFDHSHRRLTQ